MQRKSNILCIIPARGGSKGIPGKNVRVIAGKPLIAHSIEQARNTPAITRIVVSTDDAEISRVSRQFGAEVVQRPDEISGDTATSESALLHVLDHLKSSEKYVPDLVVFLQCTSPIRGHNEIQSAIETLKREKADSLLSVTASHRFLWRKEKSAYKSLNYDYRSRPRRQDRPPEFAENGSLYIFKPSILRKDNNRLGGKIAVFEMDYWSSFEIDDLEDLALCEWILKRRSHGLSALPGDLKLVVFDFDGVMTNNRVVVLQNGQEAVVCDRSDGYGIGLLKEADIPVMVISKEANPVVEARCKKLGLVFQQGIGDKLTLLKRVLQERNIAMEQIVYMGNDVNDLECMQAAGCAVAPSDAHSSVLAEADWITSYPGGQGAVRELCDAIIASRKAKK